MQRKCCTNVPTSDEVYNEHSEEEDKPPAEVLQKQLQRRAARQYSCRKLHEIKANKEADFPMIQENSEKPWS